MAVLDGWGVGAPSTHNAISTARTPFLDKCRERYPYSELQAHGRYVGLLPDQEGNSEAGHMNIGAGRTVRQDIIYVTEAIKDHTFFKNTAFKEALTHAQKHKSRVHIMGLLSNTNSAHAAPEHLYALLDLMRAEQMKRVFLHLFTDGRDSPPFSASHLLHSLEEHLDENQQIASLMGRFYGMDRNKLWRRTETAYGCIVLGEGLAAPNAHSAIMRAYSRGESDEFIMPTVIVDERHKPLAEVEENDVIFFFNLRSDRARQMAKPFVQHDFEKMNDGAFKRRRLLRDIRFVAMTDFGPDLPSILTAFPSHDVPNALPAVLAGRRQFYIAESEKYAHVTYFFNGGYADVLYGEERMRVPSAFVPHHDSKPGMRAQAIADEIVHRLKRGAHDFIVFNLANADMVGHTGNFQATVEACEHVDQALGRIAKEVLAKKGHLIITGDHGNAELKVNVDTGEVMTEHTTNPVPFYLISDRYRRKTVGAGMLADVAPTILDIMNIPKPPEMTGFSLLR